MAEKSPNAFRTISEVSDVLDVPAHVLRFWESRFTQIKPIKRGGGRRYYRPTDVELIRGIRTLLYTDGLTIKGAQKVLREKGVRHVMELGSDAGIADLAQSKTTQPKAAAPAAPDTDAPVTDAPVTEMAEAPAPGPQEPAENNDTTDDWLAPAAAEAPETAPDYAPEQFAETESDFGATFAFEAVEVGFMDASVTDADTQADTGQDTDANPATETTSSDPAPQIAAEAPEPVAAPEDAAPKSAGSETAADDTTDKLRDIIGKMERLRDSMRAK